MNMNADGWPPFDDVLPERFKQISVLEPGPGPTISFSASVCSDMKSIITLYSDVKISRSCIYTRYYGLLAVCQGAMHLLTENINNWMVGP